MRKKIIGFLIMTIFLVSLYASATNVSQSEEILDQSQNMINVKKVLSPSNQLAQSFVPSLNKLTKIDLYLIKYGNPSYTDIIFSIKDSQSEANVAVIEKSIEEISTGWLELDFEDLDVTPKKFYYIVCKAVGEWNFDFENALYWAGSSGNPYLPGTSFYIYNSVWDEEYTFDPIDFCFKTYGFNNNPPIKPIINGDMKVTLDTEYHYSFLSTDLEQNEISYYIDWGDNTNTGWTRLLSSGEYFNSSHTWIQKGSYTIKAKAKDIYGAESEWSTFIVSMPKNIDINIIIFLQKIIQRFPIFEKMLNQIV